MTLGVFKPGTPTTVAASVVVPDIHPYCACDLDRTGDISSNDFFAFIAGFFALQADFNGDGVVNTEDFFEFLTCFFNACQ